MAIQKPEPRLLRSIPLAFVRKRVAGGGSKSVSAEVTLVPFIDLLLCMVVFLLTTFGTNELSTPASVTMPVAVEAASLDELAPVIVIDRDVVTLEGRRVADTHALEAEAERQRIEPLVADLAQLASSWQLVHPGQAFPRTVILQADRDTDMRVVKSVMFSVAQAGYADVRLAVTRASAMP